MPFARRKRGQVLIVHNHRSAGNKPRQVVLHTFASSEELAATLQKESWLRFQESMAWRHPDYSWDWPRLGRRLAELLDDWGSGPQGAVARREHRVSQLATDLDARLRGLTSASAADAAVIEGARSVLADLQQTLARLLIPQQGRGDLQQLEAEGESGSRRSGERDTRGRAAAVVVDDQARREADRLFNIGMEHWWRGDRQTACRWFRKALKVQPTHADAHNHLGIRNFDQGRLKQAERCFTSAIDGGAQDLIQEAGQIEWGYTKNRPYLRGLGNLALVRQRQRRYAEALEIHERLLRMNPNDNQGVRWLLGAGYHRLGQLEVAIKAYEAAQEEPGCCYGLALALFEAGEPRAGLALIRGFAKNRYIAPMLLGEPWTRIDASHDTNMAEPEWAAAYVEKQGDLWRKVPESKAFLHRFWSAEPVRAWLAEIEALMRVLDQLAPGDKRSLLVARRLGLCAEGQLRIVAGDVDPETIGAYIPRRAFEDHDDASEVSDRVRPEHRAVEVPPGRPQLEYMPEADQWVPRGQVIRALIEDRGHEVRVIIDGRELTQEDFGRMLTTYSGWGMRLTFVPDDELTVEPTIEIKDPDEPEAPASLTSQPWIPGGGSGPTPSA